MNEQSPSQKSQVSPWFFFFFFSIVITHNVNKKRDAERKGSIFPSWESKVGEKEKQFWLSDPLRRPERRTARDEREREFGTMVIVEFFCGFCGSRSCECMVG